MRHYITASQLLRAMMAPNIQINRISAFKRVFLKIPVFSNPLLNRNVKVNGSKKAAE
jgi:hypothetical protein